MGSTDVRSYVVGVVRCETLCCGYCTCTCNTLFCECNICEMSCCECCNTSFCQCCRMSGIVLWVLQDVRRHVASILDLRCHVVGM